MFKKELSMEMRVLLAFALSALVLLVFAPQARKPAPQQPAPVPAPVAPGGPAKPAQPQPAPGTTTEAPPLAFSSREDVKESETTVDNDFYRVRFSNRGGVVKSWVLKKYEDNKGQLLDVVDPAAAAVLGGPFSVWAEQAPVREKLNSALFVLRTSAPQGASEAKALARIGLARDGASEAKALALDGASEAKALALDGASTPATVTMEFSDGTLVARKEFRFEHDNYVVHIRSEISNAGAPLAHELLWLGGFGDHSVPQAHLTNHLLLAGGGKLERPGYKDVKSGTLFSGPFVYTGLEDLFFAAVFMPAADSVVAVPQSGSASPGPGQPGPAPRAGASLDVVGRAGSASLAGVREFRDDFKPAENQSSVPLLGLAVGGAAVNNLRLYLGPKDLDILKTVFPEPDGAERQKRGEPVTTLGELVDFGWFSPIALPLFMSLKWIYHHVVANYGWAITLITVVINFALLPLKLKSMRSALKMQKLAPQVKAIQEKYKKYKLNDPRRQQQNQEMMELYKKHGVNPLGGCLPMALQIPFLYGFYKVLSVSIEMRHAGWLWVRDLSAPEKHWFKVLPISMIVTMLVLQKMTPQTTTDPVQQRMFALMPLMFGVMFYNVSSGLVLYWLVGNLVQILQQWYINKTEMQPARERDD